MTNVTEKWLPVAGYEGLYEISNLGRLKSLKKILKLKGNHTLIYEERIMKLKVSETRRYYQVKLYKEAVYKYWFIHRLVAFHFIENVQNKPQINHKNGIKTDNRVENLEWCSISHNTKHGYMFHKHKAGEEWCVSKLRNNEALKIRKYFGVLAVSPIELSKMFNVSVSTIRNIIKNRTYLNIT